jgi:hypothetical protein
MEVVGSYQVVVIGMRNHVPFRIQIALQRVEGQLLARIIVVK